MTSLSGITLATSGEEDSNQTPHSFCIIRLSSMFHQLMSFVLLRIDAELRATQSDPS